MGRTDAASGIILVYEVRGARASSTVRGPSCWLASGNGRSARITWFQVTRDWFCAASHHVVSSVVGSSWNLITAGRLVLGP
jgi:hypothetical protein